VVLEIFNVLLAFLDQTFHVDKVKVKIVTDQIVSENSILFGFTFVVDFELFYLSIELLIFKQCVIEGILDIASNCLKLDLPGCLLLLVGVLEFEK